MLNLININSISSKAYNDRCSYMFANNLNDNKRMDISYSNSIMKDYDL